MPTQYRLYFYLRQQTEEQALYRYLMRRSTKERTALLRNMILAEFRRRRTKEAAPTRKKPAPRPPRTTVKQTRPTTTGPTAVWNQRVQL